MKKRETYIHLAIRLTVFLSLLITPMVIYAQEKKEDTEHNLKSRKKEVADSIRMVERGMKSERDSTNKVHVVKRDSLIEIKHGLRIGVDLFTPLLPILGGNDDMAWQVKTDFRLTPKLYAAFDVGYQDRSKDFMMHQTRSKGMFFKAGVNYALLRGIFDSDDMMYVGLKLGYSSYDRHIWGDTLREPQWGNEVIVDINDKPMALWGDLSIGVMVQVARNVYLSMDAAYDMILSSSDSNGIGPMMVPGVGQVYSNTTGFSFSYAVSYRIPLYTKTHRMKIKEHIREDQETISTKKKKEEFTPAFQTSTLIEE
jgi:hypothetical protein